VVRGAALLLWFHRRLASTPWANARSMQRRRSYVPDKWPNDVIVRAFPHHGAAPGPLDQEWVLASRSPLDQVWARPRCRSKDLRVYALEWFGVMLNLSGKLGFRSAWFIDAFAGPGRFKDGVGTAPGSPVIACEPARDIAAEAKRKNRD